MIWSNEFLNRVALEAEIEIAKQVPCIIDRYSSAVGLHQSEILLPDYVNNIRRVFWRGERLIPYSGLSVPDWNYDQETYQNGAFEHTAFTSAFHIGGLVQTGSWGKPHSYFYSHFGENVMRLNPSSNEELPQYTNGLFDTNIGNGLIIEFYRVPDGVNWRIPEYFRRRTIRAYVLWKAYAKEGDGQNIKASDYFKARYTLYLARAQKLIENLTDAVEKARPPQNVHATREFIKRRGPLPANYGIPVSSEEWYD